MVMNLRVPFGAGRDRLPERRPKLVYEAHGGDSVNRQLLRSFNCIGLMFIVLDGIGQYLPSERGTV